jgi:hypothetical protein
MGSKLYLDEAQGKQSFIFRIGVICTQGPEIMFCANYWIERS